MAQVDPLGKAGEIGTPTPALCQDQRGQLANVPWLCVLGKVVPQHRRRDQSGHVACRLIHDPQRVVPGENIAAERVLPQCDRRLGRRQQPRRLGGDTLEHTVVVGARVRRGVQSHQSALQRRIQNGVVRQINGTAALDRLKLGSTPLIVLVFLDARCFNPACFHLCPEECKMSICSLEYQFNRTVLLDHRVVAKVEVRFRHLVVLGDLFSRVKSYCTCLTIRMYFLPLDLLTTPCILPPLQRYGPGDFEERVEPKGVPRQSRAQGVEAWLGVHTVSSNHSSVT